MNKNSIRLDMPPQAEYITERLSESGYSAYIVGGCIRDAVLGYDPKDWDIATSAEPDEIKRVFEGIPVIETGVKHGTVTVLVEHTPYEVTTFRMDGSYTDNRHPDSVSFVKSLDEDLRRRDFTMNAMAYDCMRGEIIDPFGGASDIRNKCIRSVGDPKRRFEEDALRILRGLRFSAVLGFKIESGTARAIFECADRLKNVSAERVFSELKLLLCGEYAAEVLREFRRVFEVIMPEIGAMYGLEQRGPYHCYDVWEHTLHAVEAVPREADLRLTILFHDIGKPKTHTVEHTENGDIDRFFGHSDVSEEIAAVILNRLKSDNALKSRVKTLVKHHGIDLSPTRKIIKRRLNKFGEETLRKLIFVKRADTLAQSPSVIAGRMETLAEAERLMNEIIAENECFSLRDLAIDGRDVMRMGFKDREIGEVLKNVMSAILDERLENDKASIMEYIEKNFIG